MDEIAKFMSSPNDGYVAVKGGGVRKPQKIQLETKEHFWYLGIGRILFNSLMHGTVNTCLSWFSNLR